MEVKISTPITGKSMLAGIHQSGFLSLVMLCVGAAYLQV
jgi:hypothetical protein